MTQIKIAKKTDLTAAQARLTLAESNGAVVQATKTTTYPMTSSDGTILADATSAGFTVTLPAAAGTGQRVLVRKVDSSANIVTINRAGTDTIDLGETSFTLTLQYDYVELISRVSGHWDSL